MQLVHNVPSDALLLAFTEAKPCMQTESRLLSVSSAGMPIQNAPDGEARGFSAAARRTRDV